MLSENVSRFYISKSDLLDNHGKVSIDKLPSDFQDILKKVETLEKENMVLHFRIDNIETRVNKIQVRINKIETQMDLFEKEIKNQVKQEILEEMDRRIANATFEKKGPGLWDRVRGYFVNKKMRMEVGKQLL